jgi:hypothetical protein
MMRRPRADRRSVRIAAAIQMTILRKLAPCFIENTRRHSQGVGRRRSS